MDKHSVVSVPYRQREPDRWYYNPQMADLLQEGERVIRHKLDLLDRGYGGMLESGVDPDFTVEMITFSLFLRLSQDLFGFLGPTWVSAELEAVLAAERTKTGSLKSYVLRQAAAVPCRPEFMRMMLRWIISEAYDAEQGPPMLGDAFDRAVPPFNPPGVVLIEQDPFSSEIIRISYCLGNHDDRFVSVVAGDTRHVENQAGDA